MATSGMNQASPPPPTAPKPQENADLFATPGSSAKPKGGGLTPMLGAIILVIVMVVAGVGAFVAFNVSTASTTQQQCVPTCPSSTGGGTGATVFAPITSSSTGNPLSFSVNTPKGAPVSTIFNFGDGNKTTSKSATITHAYSSPGIFFVTVTATAANGFKYTNAQAATIVDISPSSLTQAPNEPTLSGSVVSGTSASLPATGGSVTLQGNVTEQPANVAWNVTSTKFVSLSSNLTVATVSTSSSGTTATVTTVSGAGVGVYSVNFEAVSQSGTLTAVDNYTFSVGVGVQVPAPAKHVSPHPGIIDNYELAPGGSYSEDPAIDYETLGTEVIYNVYQTLISYNGSVAGPNPNDFVPNLATCVPGTAYCTDLYGSSMVFNGGSTFTFVINKNANFYNPYAGTTYGVWPSDVVYSYARTCALATYPFSNPGWIQCQALLPTTGNASWDIDPIGAVGLHFYSAADPFNNTPMNIFNAITMNNTAAGCTQAMMTDEHGCVTFNTTASGHDWPDFLEFLVDGYGGGIVSCTWAASIGNGLPGFPCSSTVDPTGIAPTAWDNYMLGTGSAGTDYEALSSSVPVSAGTLYNRWHMVGSGPYYLSSLIPGTSYQLKTNPGWEGTGITAGTSCNWKDCIPATFPINTVNVVWETSQSTGEIALEHGTADFASVPGTDFSTVLIPLLQSGQVTLTSATGLSIFFSNYNLDFNMTGAIGLMPAGTTLNAPTDLMQDLQFRQFLTDAFPYATVGSQYDTIDGIQTSVLFGGAIPKYMGNYYPENVSWPLGNPVQDNVTQAWAAVESEGGIAASACKVSDPCVFPLIGENGAPLQDEIDSLWASDIAEYSGGAVKVISPDDQNFIDSVLDSLAPAGENPMPMYILGWAPDYPDPTDYVGPMYLPDGDYTYGDAINESLVGSGLYNGACPAGWEWAAPGAANAVTTACQGTAYAYAVQLMNEAAFDTNLAQRALLYNEASHIMAEISIIICNPGQETTNWIASNWIDGATLNTNPTIGGGGDLTYFDVGYV